MKNHLVVLAAAWLAAAVSGWAQEAAPIHTPAPKLVCEEPVYDFGTVESSVVVEHEFIVRNDGDLTLEIKNVRPSCGCTVANISERNVPPGGTTRIGSRLSLSGRSGGQHKVMTVESNDPQQPNYVLTLKGTVGELIDVQPPRVTQVGLQAGAQPTNVIRITSQPGQPFQITSVESSANWLQASVETIDPNQRYQLVVAPTTPLMPGQHNATLAVNTDHPKKPKLDIPVVFIVSAELVVAPRELVFAAPSDEQVTRYLILRSSPGTSLGIDQIAGVDTPDPAIAASLSPFGPNGVRVQLANLAPRAELDGKSIRIRFSTPGQRPIEVPLRIAAPTPPPAS